MEPSIGDDWEGLRSLNGARPLCITVLSACIFQADAIDFARLWSPKLYIENSLGDPKEQIRHRIIYNEKGEAFIYEKRVAKGTFMENLELDDFPFDVQVKHLLTA